MGVTTEQQMSFAPTAADVASAFMRNPATAAGMPTTMSTSPNGKASTAASMGVTTEQQMSLYQMQAQATTQNEANVEAIEDLYEKMCELTQYAKEMRDTDKQIAEYHRRSAAEIQPAIAPIPGSSASTLAMKPMNSIPDRPNWSRMNTASRPNLGATAP